MKEESTINYAFALKNYQQNGKGRSMRQFCDEEGYDYEVHAVYPQGSEGAQHSEGCGRASGDGQVHTVGGCLTGIERAWNPGRPSALHERDGAVAE